MNDAEQLKLKGMETVYAHTSEQWKQYVEQVIAALPTGTLVTGEDIRLKCELQPHHHNAWGAIISLHVRKGILQPTGMYTKMRSRKSHARTTQIYRKC